MGPRMLFYFMLKGKLDREQCYFGGLDSSVAKGGGGETILLKSLNPYRSWGGGGGRTYNKNAKRSKITLS